MNTKAVFLHLDQELKTLGIQRDLFICGGAALIALGIVHRQTRDVDVVLPKIDEELSRAANKVGEKLNLKGHWLNNGPDDLLKYLETGWQKRSQLAFDGHYLRVFSLCRQDLFNTKLWAACDRIDDVNDIIAMQPTEKELHTAKKWTLQCDASEKWGQIVGECVQHIKERLTNG